MNLNNIICIKQPFKHWEVNNCIDNLTLDEAQLAKMELIAKKLDLKPGMSVLDIGCGFGSMGNHLATKYKVKVLGVTLSKEQKKYADKNFSNKNVIIKLKDYRHVTGKFDRDFTSGGKRRRRRLLQSGGMTGGS